MAREIDGWMDGWIDCMIKGQRGRWIKTNRKSHILTLAKDWSTIEERSCGTPPVNASSAVKVNNVLYHDVLQSPPRAPLGRQLGVTEWGPSPLSAVVYRMGRGCWVSSRPKRFFTVTRCLENLSSGEKRAGWAELVGLPKRSIF